MSLQSWVEVLACSKAAATLFNTYTTAKTVINPTELVPLPANWWYVGRTIRVTIQAGVSNRVTGPDTTTLQLMMGTTSVFSSGALNLTTTAHTTIPAMIYGIFTCRTIGATANLMGQWIVEGQMFAMAASIADNGAGSGWAMGPNTAPAVGSNFDSTVAQTIDFWVAQSVSNAGNGIQVQQYLVEALN